MGSNPTEIVPHNPYLCVLKDGLNWLPILGHKTWEMSEAPFQLVCNLARYSGYNFFYFTWHGRPLPLLRSNKMGFDFFYK